DHPGQPRPGAEQQHDARGDRADAEPGREPRVLVGPSGERVLAGDGQAHLVLVRERAHHGHHGERPEELGVAADDAQGRTQLAPLARDPSLGADVRGPHREQERDDEHEAPGVRDEAPPDAHAPDERRRHHGAHAATHVREDAVERHGAVERLAPDELGISAMRAGLSTAVSTPNATATAIASGSDWWPVSTTTPNASARHAS